MQIALTELAVAVYRCPICGEEWEVQGTASRRPDGSWRFEGGEHFCPICGAEGKINDLALCDEEVEECD